MSWVSIAAPGTRRPVQGTRKREPDLNILLTVHQFLPDYASGTEILTYSTARELRTLGHNVRIVAGYPERAEMSDEARFDTYQHEGLHVVRFHHAYVPMGGQTNVAEAEYNNLLAARGFRDVLEDFRPDVVHFFHLARLSASLIDVCRSVRIPMVLTPTDFWFVCPTSQLRLPDNALCDGPDRFGVNCLRHVVSLTQPPATASKVEALPHVVIAAIIAGCRAGLFGSRSYAPLVKALAERPGFLRSRLNVLDRVLVPTRIMEQKLIENGLSASKTVFCPYGIDIPTRTATGTHSEPRRSNILRVGFIGTLYEHKGAHVLMEAVRRLAGRPIELKIYGRLEDFPDYVERLRTLASGDGRIRLLGTFPNESIGDIFSDLDVLVVPSLWYENTPLVIYSAQALGCPVVATDLGGMSEAVSHGDNGLLFSKGDVSELASLLDRLVGEPELLTRLRKNARPPKSIRQYAAECVAVYDEVSMSGGAAPAGSL